MVYLAKGGFWQMTERVSGILSGLVTTWAFANLLPATSYGEYKYVLSLAMLLTTFSLTGIGIAVAKAAAQGHDGTYKKAFSVSYKYSVALIAIALAAAAHYWTRGNTTLGAGLLLIAVFQPLINSTNVFGHYLIGKKRFDLKTRYAAIQQILVTVGLLSALLLTKSVPMLLAAYFFLTAAACTWIYLRVGADVAKDTAVEAGFERYAKHLSVIRVLGYVASQIDSILLFQLAGAGTLAAYSVAIVIPVHVKALSKNLGSIAFAKFAANDERRTVQNLFKKAGLLFLLLLAVTIVYIVLAPFVFDVFFPQYRHAVFASQVVALTIPFSTRLVFQGLFEARGKIREQYTVNIFSGLLLILTFSTLIPLYGLMGAVYARLISRVATTCVSTYLLLRIKNTWNDPERAKV